MIEEYLRIKEIHDEKYDDEYFTFNRANFETDEGILKEIAILKDSIDSNKPIKYEDLGYSIEESEMIRNGEMLI